MLAGIPLGRDPGKRWIIHGSGASPLARARRRWVPVHRRFVGSRGWSRWSASRSSGCGWALRRRSPRSCRAGRATARGVGGEETRGGFWGPGVGAEGLPVEVQAVAEPFGGDLRRLADLGERRRGVGGEASRGSRTRRAGGCGRLSPTGTAGRRPACSTGRPRPARRPAPAPHRPCTPPRRAAWRWPVR